MKNYKRVKDPDIAKILNMRASFENLDVAYDLKRQVASQLKRAKKFNVKTSVKSVDDRSETVTGRLGDCLAYLNPYMEADFGYQAASALAMKLRKTNVGGFNKFVDWMSASEEYSSFKAGIADNDAIKAQLN